VRRTMVAQSILESRVPGGEDAALAPTDGPAAVYRPESADHWTALGLPAPSFQWNCQEASGNLATAIGSATLTANGAGHLYQQSVTGWTAKFVGLDGSAHRFITTNAALDLDASESYAWLYYAAATAATGSNRYLATQADAAFGLRLIDAAHGSVPGTPYAACGTTVAAGAANHSNIAVVRPYLIGRNCTASAARCFTNLEQVNPTYTANASAATSAKALGEGSSSSLASRFTMVAAWFGADAETILAKTTLTTLGWSLPY
jgi:hypothetical protein